MPCGVGVRVPLSGTPLPRPGEPGGTPGRSGPGQPPARTRATTGAIARSALPSVGDGILLLHRQLGRGPLVPVGDEQHVVAEAAGAAQLPDHPARHLAVHHLLVDVGRRGVAERHRAAELRRPAARPGRRRAAAAAGRCWRRRPSRLPAHRADSTPGIPLSASTQRPQSSASDGRPVAASPGTRLEQGVARERRLGLGRLVVRRDVVEAEHLDAGQRARPGCAAAPRSSWGCATRGRPGSSGRAPPCWTGEVGAALARPGRAARRARRGRTARARRCPAPRRTCPPR